MYVYEELNYYIQSAGYPTFYCPYIMSSWRYLYLIPVGYRIYEYFGRLYTKQNSLLQFQQNKWTLPIYIPHI